MKTNTHRSLVSVLCLVSLAAVAAESPAPRPRLTPELRRQAEISAPAERTSAASGDAAEALPPLRVNDTYVAPPHAPTEPVPTAHPFTLTEGGTFLSRTGRHFTSAVGLQYNPDVSAFNLLGFSW